MSDTITRILVPTDFSPHADRALCYATTLAHRLGAELDLLHVVDDPFASGAWTSAEIYVPTVVELVNDFIDSAKQRLAKLTEGAAALGLTVHVEVVTGRAAQAIIDHAAANGCDLIVMGTHGRTGLSHAILGSVAEQVVRRASCPVLTIRAPEATTANDKPAAA